MRDLRRGLMFAPKVKLALEPLQPQGGVIRLGWLHWISKDDPEVEDDYEIHDIEQCPSQPCPDCIPVRIVHGHGATAHSHLVALVDELQWAATSYGEALHTGTHEAIVSTQNRLVTARQGLDAELDATAAPVVVGEDAKRLDWLATQFRTCTVYMNGSILYKPGVGIQSLIGTDFRSAIDAAMTAALAGEGK